MFLQNGVFSAAVVIVYLDWPFDPAHTERLFFADNNIFFGYCEPFRYPNYVRVFVLLKYEFIYFFKKG